MSKSGYAKLDRGKLHASILRMQKRVSNTRHELWGADIAKAASQFTAEERKALRAAEEQFSTLGAAFKSLSELARVVRERIGQ
jgi:hypothetical protein